MNKEEFLAASLPYNLKCSCSLDNKIFNLIGFTSIVNFDIVRLQITNDETQTVCLAQDAIPIIRPMSELTERCIQANYNDGKPFVPIIELAKMYFPLADDWSVEDGICSCGSFEHFVFKDGVFQHWNDYDGCECEDCMGECKIPHQPVKNQLKLFQKLLQWHFWPDMPEDEKVLYMSNNNQ